MAAANGDAGAIYVTTSKLRVSNRWYSQLKKLQEFYSNQFAAEPKFFVRVPGRVNIIGEHVDYCGYPVLPMAIDQCILLAIGYTEENSILQLRNLEGEKFENYKCDLNELRIDLPKTGGPEWYKYFLCGIKGIYETLEADFLRIGMNVALCGNIPPASGLSSSSALVSAATLATAHVHRLPLERKRLAAISASCERYIGTQGGGMDQAIAYLAKEGCAQFIEFQPELCATPIQLPEGVCFVVANSLAAKNKAASSDFNERVVECRLACRILAKILMPSQWRQLTRLAQLQQELGCTLAQLEALADKWLPKESYTRLDICEELGIAEVELVEQFLTENTRKMTVFKLRQRTRHVLHESMRVAKFRALCEQSNTNGADECKHLNGHSNGNSNCNSNGVNMDAQSSLTTLLSTLMRQSHHSLRHNYECSHPQLDHLVDISETFGVSARLTGAGWGGCIVALCDSIETSTLYIQLLREKYFTKLPAKLIERHQENDFEEVVFATFPRNGAEIFTPTTTTTTTTTMLVDGGK